MLILKHVQVLVHRKYLTVWYLTVKFFRFWIRSIPDRSRCSQLNNYNPKNKHFSGKLWYVQIQRCTRFFVKKHYESKQYKKGVKTADSILNKYPDHGGMFSL